jgi:phosphate transport system substrate-binding protein
MKPGKAAAGAIIGAVMLAGAIALYAATKTITVKGSDTMVILAQRWAENYMANHTDLSVVVSGGGSGVGISALINGTTDICNASRPMKEAEHEKLREKYGTPGVEIPVARDGITLYANEENPVKELSLEQIGEIFTGVIKNWKEVGGAEAKINLYGRENSSGTYAYFQEDVLKGKDYSPLVQSLSGTAEIVNAVAKDRWGVGYGGVAYARGVKRILVRKDARSPAYEATPATIASGKYPISRYLYIYLRTRPTGDIKAFIDWILSRNGQAVVKDVGYFPVK